MDAITFLRQEHTKFRQTLKSISKISNDKLKQAKFNAFCKELIRHETMEQKAWYPVLRKNSELRDVIKHLLSEEKSAAKTIKKFKQTGFGIIWKLRFYKFKHDVDHHAKEEEQALFPKVRKLFSKKELNTLGVKMRKFKSKKK
ncbi:MAG: hemerythrin domain-containing protein [Gammaproteobacteria bacterium]|nr:hemerythrin domain-containing protein [Gammaproteobacteria bacterium]